MLDGLFAGEFVGDGQQDGRNGHALFLHAVNEVGEVIRIGFLAADLECFRGVVSDDKPGAGVHGSMIRNFVVTQQVYLIQYLFLTIIRI